MAQATSSAVPPSPQEEVTTTVERLHPIPTSPNFEVTPTIEDVASGKGGPSNEHTSSAPRARVAEPSSPCTPSVGFPTRHPVPTGSLGRYRTPPQSLPPLSPPRGAGDTHPPCVGSYPDSSAEHEAQRSLGEDESSYHQSAPLFTAAENGDALFKELYRLEGVMKAGVERESHLSDTALREAYLQEECTKLRGWQRRHRLATMCQADNRSLERMERDLTQKDARIDELRARLAAREGNQAAIASEEECDTSGPDDEEDEKDVHGVRDPNGNNIAHVMISGVEGIQTRLDQLTKVVKERVVGHTNGRLAEQDVAHRIDLAKRLDDRDKEYEVELSIVMGNHADDMDAKDRQLADIKGELQRLQETHAANIGQQDELRDKLNAARAEALEDLRAKLEAAHQEDLQQRLEQLNGAHKVELQEHLARLEGQHRADLEKRLVERDAEREVQQQKALADQLAAHKTDIETRLAHQDQEHQAELSRIKERYDSDLAARNRELERTKLDHARKSEERDDLRKQLVDDHSQKVETLRKDLMAKQNELENPKSDQAIAMEGKDSLSKTLVDERTKELERDLAGKHAKALERERAEHTQAMDDLADTHAKDLERLREDHTAEIDHLRGNHERELERLRTAHSEELDREHKKLAAAEDRFKRELDAHAQGVQDEQSPIVQDLRAELAAAVKGREEAKTALEAEHDSALRQLRDNSAAELASDLQKLREAHADAVRDMVTAHQTAFDRLRDEHAIDVAARLEALRLRLVAVHADGVKAHVAQREETVKHLEDLRTSELADKLEILQERLRSEHDRILHDRETESQQALDDLREAHADDLAIQLERQANTLELEHQAATSLLKEDYVAQLDRLQRQHSDALEVKEQVIHRLQEEIDSAVAQQADVARTKDKGLEALRDRMAAENTEFRCKMARHQALIKEKGDELRSLTDTSTISRTARDDSDVSADIDGQPMEGCVLDLPPAYSSIPGLSSMWADQTYATRRALLKLLNLLGPSRHGWDGSNGASAIRDGGDRALNGGLSEGRAPHGRTQRIYPVLGPPPLIRPTTPVAMTAVQTSSELAHDHHSLSTLERDDLRREVETLRETLAAERATHSERLAQLDMLSAWLLAQRKPRAESVDEEIDGSEEMYTSAHGEIEEGQEEGQDGDTCCVQ